MTNTLISVIIVVYNSAQYIERAIKSVINQTYFHIDFIVIDGGSTDGTVDIIKSYSNYISYWKSEPDKGIYDAMNKGWKQAKGDYILYLGADDLLLPDGLKYLTENSENFDVVYGNAIYMHPGNIEKKQKNVD
jgi:glycosyltransferase involved in cell wall biosynthesis